MSGTAELTLATATDEQLRTALLDAHIPALLCAMAHWTGSTEHFAEVQPFFDPFAEDEDGLEEADRQRVRSMALEALRSLRDGGMSEQC